MFWVFETSVLILGLLISKIRALGSNLGFWFDCWNSYLYAYANLTDSMSGVFYHQYKLGLFLICVSCLLKYVWDVFLDFYLSGQGFWSFDC